MSPWSAYASRKTVRHGVLQCTVFGDMGLKNTQPTR
jgi:hypothetical protein